MAQSKLELAVGTGKWDAGLKKAQQALNSFTQAQGGLQQAIDKDNGKMQSFVQMMGKMDSTASTAKGQMNDYKRVLEQLTADYNKMSEAQRKSIGTDYLQTIDALKQKFQAAKQQVDEFNRSLGNTSEIKLPEGGNGLFGGGKLDGMLQVFGGNLMTKAAGFAASFASEIGSCVQQGIELARQGEGIRNAFERLGRGDILDGLREATHGTVTDIELMKAAVKFNDFKLPLEELGTMLAFAQQKAKDTGQSVDYMVDSIVTGLGRKSLMILDNLGLSAAEIKERMKETGDMTKAVGAIIREQMAKAGDYVETAADRAAQANVSLQNKMEELGRKFAPVEEASNQLWTSMKIGILDIIGGPLATLLNKLTEAGRLKNALNDINGDGSNGSETKVEKALRMLREYSGGGKGAEGKRDLYNRQMALYSSNEEKDWRNYNRLKAAEESYRKSMYKRGQNAGDQAVLDDFAKQIENARNRALAWQQMAAQYEQGAKSILTPVKVDIDTSGAEQNLDSLKKKLKELEAQRREAVKKGDNEQVDNLTKQINDTKQKIGYLDPNALKTTKTDADELQKVQKKIADLTKEAYTADESRQAEIQKEIAGLQQQEQKLIKIRDLVTGKNDDKGLEIVNNFDTGSVSPAQSFIDKIKSDIAQANIDEDMNRLAQQMTVAFKGGMEEAELSEVSNEFLKKILNGENIPTEVWDDLKEYIQENIVPETQAGEAKTKENDGFEALSQSINKASTAVNALSSINSGLNGMGIDLGDDIDNALGAMQSLMTVIQGVQAIVSLFQTPAVISNTAALTALNTTLLVKSFLPGFANGGIVPAFAQGGLIGRAAAGMMIPGNSMSGDRLRLPVDGGRGIIGVNSGELILNKSSQNTLAADLLNAEALIGSIKDYSVSLGNAQQTILAQELEGGGFDNLQLDTRVSAEDIIFILNNNGNRRGYGDFIND